MENYLLVNNYGKSNTPDRIYYIMRRSDLPNLIKEESVVFGDKAYILEEGTMMFMGNDGIWYDTEGEVPLITAKELNVTQNGTYIDPDPYVAYRPVNVQVTDYNVEGLNVTENGTYSESGKAYSPVVVNVPLPENAYLKKDLPTGAIATVTDAEVEIMPSLKVAITPVQSGSGDPSPDNIRPISGWDEVNVGVSGVNIWDEEWENGYRQSKTGAIVPNGSNVTNKNLIRCLPNTSYYWYVGKSGQNYIIYFDAEQNIIMAYWTYYNITFTTPSNCYYIAFTVDNTTYNHDISINYPATDHEYHPYTGQDYSITFPSEAGTVYGGTLDVTGGELVVTHAEVDMGTLAWMKSSGRGGYFWVDLPLRKIGSALTSSVYPYYGTRPATYASASVGLYQETMTADKYVDIYDPSYSDVAEIVSVLNGQQLVYELAEPIHYPLEATEIRSLIGENNIWADTGDILEGKYWSKNPVTVTRAMLSTLRSAGEITEITEPEEPEEPEELEELEESEENDER